MQEKIVALLTPAFLYLIIFLLNALLPGRWVKGYVNKPHSSEKITYHLNGILVFFVMVIGWFLLGYYQVIPFDWLYRFRWYELTGAFAIGILFSLAVVLPYPNIRKNFVADFYYGRIENIQWIGGRIDAKMWLYLAGAIVLELNALSFTAHHLMLFGTASSTGIMLTTILLTFFVVDYLTFEEVHLYTYDLFAERVGFKLGWGCLVFYPYFYAIPLWSTVDLPSSHIPGWLFVVFILIFLTGWSLSRGANLQKFYFKKDPSKPFLGIYPQTISNGSQRLLVNGFWGISRHVNYLGEILMATGIVLCTGYPTLFWPWLYPLYYVFLLFPRQQDDDVRCAQKYGPLWDEYKAKVPYRIIPRIY
jgi:delta14-sterol reductase